MPKKYRPRKSVRPIIVPIGPGIAYVPLTDGLFALIEVEDIPLVEGASWHACRVRRRGGSAQRYHAVTYKGGKQRMHNTIMRPAAGVLVDHRNSNPLDCRRQGNMRFASRRQNNQNRAIRHDSRTGLKWTFFRKDSGLYRSQVSVDGKKINCGNHPTAEAAHAAAAAKAKELHGEFLRLA